MSENICEKVLIEAYTGSGKTYSIMNIDPDQAMIIQVSPKRLTFPEGINWKPWDNKEKKGSIMSVSRIRDAAEKNKIPCSYSHNTRRERTRGALQRSRKDTS